MNYSIIRFYQHHKSRTIKEGLTREEAKTHCNDPETASRTATAEEAVDHTREHGPWFDGFQEGGEA